jgi:hypothetical protein
MFLRKAFAFVLVVGSLTALAWVGGGFVAGGSSASAAYAYQYQYGVTICHHTGTASNPLVTITVSANALSTFLAQGDSVGACAR